MKNFKILLIAFLSLFLMNCSKTTTEKNKVESQVIADNIEVEKPKEATLFERLGGTEGISLIIDQMVDAHMQNPKIKHIFIPLSKDPENFNRIKQNVKDFLSAGSGGNAKYVGKDLPSAHKGLQTTEADWVAATDDLMQVLRNNSIDEETQKDVLFILYSLKGQVIGK
ncbi:MAG: group 1 truncated hemoglobin [Bacteroidota bacterium]